MVGIWWGALACLVERDLKRLIAFSSVAHMGFVLVGISSGTAQGVQGALFANVAHGVITGLLFFVVGAIKDRAHTGLLSELGMPRTLADLGLKDEQLEGFIQPTWQALVDGAKYVEPRLREILDELETDIVVQDNVVGFAALPAVLHWRHAR